jgi:predicted dehydrogenase
MFMLKDPRVERTLYGGPKSARAGIGVAGLGHLGRFHATNLATRVPSVELVRVVDVELEIARGLGLELGVAWSTDYGALLDDSRIAGVVIVTPTSLHAEMTELAAAAGKHVFSEKPLALDVESHWRAINATVGARVILQVGFQRRFDPDYVALKETIQDGDMGEIYVFRSIHRQPIPPHGIKYDSSGGGFFIDSLIHDFECARWMVGEIVEVSSVGSRTGIGGSAADVDNVVVTLRFESGALGVVEGSRVAPHGYEASVEVLGSRAAARVSSSRRRNLELLTPARALRDYVEDFRERFASAYVNELAAFVRSTSSRRQAGAGGSDAVAAFVIAQAARESYEAHEPVEVDLSAISG